MFPRFIAPTVLTATTMLLFAASAEAQNDRYRGGPANGHARHIQPQPIGVAPPVAPSHARRVWVEPEYRIDRIPVTIPAVHEDRPKRVWIPPVTEVRRVRVDEPAVYESRRVAVRRHGRIIYRTERVLVKPPCTRYVDQTVVVCPGRWDTVMERVCVRPATVVYEERRVLVRPGYWKIIRDDVCIQPVPPPCDVTPAPRRGTRFDLRIDRDGRTGRTGVGIGFTRG
ncbi:MAG: hypothetical protein HUU22_09630 [Phycisphaerae bacterium]|nr:hypothetical protein [Phycisphaerae bacterium]NUQ46282.1 hypothetical protein [Phycisphaerae bacterium]